MTATADPARTEEVAAQRSLATNSARVGVWTLVSRVTGFARAAVIAAVLGPTFLGNTFLAVNMLPNLVYEFLTGSLLITLLVPALVRALDGQVNDGQAPGGERAASVARGFLGTLTLGIGAMTVATMVAAPAVLHVLTLGAPSAVAASQRHSGVILLLCVMPQVMLYALAGTGAAAMNANGRFALAAAAPAAENVGVIATMVVVALRFGTGPDDAQNTALLMTLGLGSTAAVLLHASLQWLGARRVGVTLYPTRGWRDPEVRDVIGRLLPSLGYAGLNVARTFILLIMANRIRGGVVAFQLALNFYYLPVAIGARPVAVALLPMLARLHVRERVHDFAREMARGMGLALFLTVPAAALYAGLGRPLADAVALGAMRDGTDLVAVALMALSVGVVGEAVFVISTHASYARNDARTPFVAMCVRSLLTIVGLAFSGMVSGSAILVVLGGALSLGNVAGAVMLAHYVRAAAPNGRRSSWAPSLLRALIASVAMLGVAWMVLAAASGTHPGRLALVLAGAFGGLTYLGAQLLLGSPELRRLAPALALVPRSSRPPKESHVR